MNKFNDVDLTRGYQKYDAMVKNIEGIFNKINQLFDISEYKKELDKIINDASNDSSFSNKMLYEGMQLDYESFILVVSYILHFLLPKTLSARHLLCA